MSVCEIKVVEAMVDTLDKNLRGIVDKASQDYDPQGVCAGLVHSLDFFRPLKIISYYLIGLKGEAPLFRKLSLVESEAVMEYVSQLVDGILINNSRRFNHIVFNLQKLTVDEFMDNMDGSISQEVFAPLEDCLRASIILEGIRTTRDAGKDQEQLLERQAIKINNVLEMLTALYLRVASESELEEEFSEAWHGWSYLQRLANVTSPSVTKVRNIVEAELKKWQEDFSEPSN